jgi:hypothetical protein
MTDLMIPPETTNGSSPDNPPPRHEQPPRQPGSARGGGDSDDERRTGFGFTWWSVTTALAVVALLFAVFGVCFLGAAAAAWGLVDRGGQALDDR